MAGRGLGSDKLSPEQKRKIQSAGGSASGGNYKRDHARAVANGRKGGSRSRRS